MNREDHLLVILSEECTEVSQQACKALRFGMGDFDPRDAQKVTNKRRMEIELAEAIAVAELLGLEIRDEDKVAKIKKVEKYMGYSRNLGKLE